MHLSYDAVSIRRWAQFTGDFDPVHFDVERAKQVGENDVIVHDMLPQLTLQQRLTPALRKIARRARRGAAGNSRDDICTRWPTMKTLFRRPVVKDRLHVLDSTLDYVRGNFDLRSSHGAGQTLSGLLFLAVFKPCAPASENRYGLPEAFEISAERLAARLRLFRRSFPDIAALWVALSALTFAEFLRAKVPLQVLRESRRGCEGAPQPEARGTITAQTAYTIAVDPGFARKTIGDILTLKGVRCALHPPIVAISKGADVSGLFPFDIAVNGRTVMQAEIGLVMLAASAAVTATAATAGVRGPGQRAV